MNQPTEFPPQNLETRQGNYLFNREVQLRSGEIVKLPTIRIERMRLFTGSPVPGIKIFRDSEEVTIGAGVYLTSQRDAARGYALVRSDRSPATPTLYEVEVADMELLNLTTKPGLRSFTKLWKEELIEWRLNKLPTLRTNIKTNNEWIRQVLAEKVQTIIGLIDNDDIEVLKKLTFSFGGLVREALTKQSFDGLVGLEGGESGGGITIGGHDSYVIFDPKRVRKIKEEAVAKL